FDGVVISDDLSNAEQVARWTPAQRAVKFVAAGGDMVLAVDPGQVPRMHRALLRRYKRNDRFAAKVDAAVRRVLKAKTP
ncbi:MAG: glycoside hydrolase family 3 N-terminal domain-containing protein, partial [Nocardioidaceae bacterium]